MQNTDEELFLLRGFYSKSKESAPCDKDCKAKVSEEDFNRKLLHQYRDRGHKKIICTTIKKDLTQNLDSWLGLYFKIL
jgi:hypothetical protein